MLIQIVRDHVISRHLPDELRAMQKTVVDTILANRPEPDGFPESMFAAPGTFEHYVARQLHWNFLGALEEGEDSADAWLTHPDSIVKTNAAMAVGLDALAALSEARESAGELVRAAQASWAASMMKGISQSIFNDLVHRAAELLERADDKEALDFEHEVLATAWYADMGSERSNKASQRQKVLAASSEATFESKVGEALAAYIGGWKEFGIFGGEGDIAAGLESMRGAVRNGVKAAELTDNSSWRNFYENVWQSHCFGVFLVASPLEGWDPDDFGGSEANLVEAIIFYEYRVCGKIFGEELLKCDMFKLGQLTLPLALYCACEIFPYDAQKRRQALTNLNILCSYRRQLRISRYVAQENACSIRGN